MIGRLLAGRRQPNAVDVFVQFGAGAFTLFTLDSHLRAGSAAGHVAVTLPDLYRWLRTQFGKRQVVMHLLEAGSIAELLDTLPNEVRFGRLSLVHVPVLPPIPADPNQEEADLVAAMEADGEVD